MLNHGISYTLLDNIQVKRKNKKDVIDDEIAAPIRPCLFIR